MHNYKNLLEKIIITVICVRIYYKTQFRQCRICFILPTDMKVVGTSCAVCNPTSSRKTLIDKHRIQRYLYISKFNLTSVCNFYNYNSFRDTSKSCENNTIRILINNNSEKSRTRRRLTNVIHNNIIYT